MPTLGVLAPTLTKARVFSELVVSSMKKVLCRMNQPSPMNHLPGSSNTAAAGVSSKPDTPEFTSLEQTSALVVTWITVPPGQEASELAGKLVDTGRAACVNIIPGVTSVYKWQGKVENDQEALLMVKTRRDLLPELTKVPRANRPVPTLCYAHRSGRLTPLL